MSKDTIKVNMNVYDIPILVEQLKKLEQENNQLKQENEKLQIQIANYNLFVNDILNQIHEFKEKMILGTKN